MSDRHDSPVPVVELQIHPGSVRWGVRVFFFTQRQIILLAMGAALLAILVAFGLGALPWVAGGLLRAREYGALLTERELQGERALTLSREFESLKANAEDLRHRMERIYLTYGMSTSKSIGQGGYPYDQGQGIESIYAGVVESGRSLESEVAQELAVLGIFLDEVESFEEAHREQVRTTPSISPLDPTTFVLTSPFGTRRSPFTKKLDAHSGLDMAAETGTPIVAPADGVVVFAGRYPARQSVSWWRYGELVAIRHGDQFITLFGHCDEVLVRTGQRVSQREVIARVGNSGWSTSPHLHYEVRHRDEEGEFVPVDPRVYILDHRWRDQEQFLVAARKAPTLKGYDPLPRLMRR